MKTRTEPEWTFYRGRGRATLWVTVHEPTCWEMALLDSSKRHAQMNPDLPDIYRLLHDEARLELSWPEDGVPTETGITVTNHDRARGLLTWLADHHPEVLDHPLSEQ